MFTVQPAVGGNPTQLFHNLSSGPNFRGITHAKHDGNLPDEWRLSFGRVATKPLLGDASWYTTVTATAFADFERACAQLLRSDVGQSVAQTVTAGVQTSQWVQQAYLAHPAPFSIRRLDIVISNTGPVVCENDEMPGGIVHAYWLDYIYGINQRRWNQALRWLANNGLLVFAVSADWSAPYIQEVAWFVQHLTSRGFNVRMVTSNEPQRLHQGPKGVYLDGQLIGTVWRLFPVFEVQGTFSWLVDAARQGKIRLVPELASWGNKAWMGIFWQHQDFFRQVMNPQAFGLLTQVLPYTRLIGLDGSFPTAIRHKGRLVDLSTYQEVRGLGQRPREATLAKLCGANPNASRSHGVVLGVTCSGAKWGRLLDELIGMDAPVALQEFRPPARMNVPVWSVLGDRPELEEGFVGKVLVRPWAINGQLVSATAFVSAPGAQKLHGTTTGAEIPLQF
jgi:hypothetical protein